MNPKKTQQGSGETTETELEEQGNEVTVPFDPKAIKIEIKQQSLDSVIKRLKYKEISFYADYQRRPDLWDEVKKSLLIESILLQLPIPAFYFDVKDADVWEVIDGLQRLSTLQSFVVDGKLKLQGLEYLTQYEGMTYSQLPRPLLRTIDETQITVFLIQKGTPDDVKFNLFRRINTGGLTLNTQEIRHSLHPGIPTNFVKKLGGILIQVFEKYSNRISQERQEHCDYATRFLAFYLLYHLKNLPAYKPELDSFLNSAMKTVKDLSEQQKTEIELKLKDTLNFIFEVLGQYAFRKAFSSRNLLNKALFEALTVQFACCNELERAILQKKKDELLEKLKALYEPSSSEKDVFEKSISTSTGSGNAVNTRHEMIRAVIREVLNA